MTGTVKWFSETRGFGFVTPTSGGKDCVVIHSAFQGNRLNGLTEGETVEFDVVLGAQCAVAENVTRTQR
jgi:CspA family cold shock protein